MPRGQSTEEFYERLLTKLGEMALRQVEPQIPSTTLRDALRLEISTALLRPRAVLYLPHYWAVWVHDGRGPVAPTERTWLVWFQNPKDDPRTAGGRNYPVRVSDVVRLTQAQWEDGLAENARRRKAGQEPYMIVTKHAGPVRFPESFAFFEAGMESFGVVVGPVVREEFDRHVKSRVPIRRESRAVLRLG